MTEAQAKAHRNQLIWFSVFAIAMAYLEAVVVVYLRQLTYPQDLRSIFPLHVSTEFNLWVEVAREAATVAIILAVAMLGQRGAMRRFAAFVYVFGLWDIFYYVWLKLTLGWPVSWLEWDVLFLIPWVWLGPWLTAAAVALLFVLWGGWLLLSRFQYRFTLLSCGLFISGALLMLAAFLQPAAGLLSRGLAGFDRYVPGAFSWGMYLAGYGLMTAGLLQTLGHRHQDTAAHDVQPAGREFR